MTKRAECPIVLLENIDNAIRGVVLECFVMSSYGSTMSPSKSPTHSFFPRKCYEHNWYNDYNRNYEKKLCENVNKLKRGEFLQLENFSVRGQYDFDKEDSDWTI